MGMPIGRAHKKSNCLFSLKISKLIIFTYKSFIREVKERSGTNIADHNVIEQYLECLDSVCSVWPVNEQCYLRAVRKHLSANK